ncbi:MAG: M20/M25/M40 family metallo-hydrolase, partial [Candidatus Eisenbacteria bacterium]
QRFQDFKTRYCTTDSCQAAANWIKAKFESFGIDSVHFHTIGGSYKPNVVATIPGKGDPSKVVIIGGHEDSISPSQYTNAPGADDNASGTACAIEAARVLCGYDFNYTITFIAFGAEEVGLYGSEAYAGDAAARGDDIVAAVAVDMIGYLAGGDAMDLDIIDNSGSVWIRDAAFQAAADYVPGFSCVDGSLPGGASSDHASFWAAGYNAILFFEDTGDYSPYIHTTSDIVGLSYNSPALARNSVKTAVGLVATLAEPFRVGIVHTPLSDTEDYTNPYRVVASISAAGTLNPDSLLVRYDAGSGYQTAPLTATGNPDEYEGFIPAQPPGTFVDYYLVAEDTDGYRKTHPSTAPASAHSFFVGSVLTIIEDDFEIDRGWTAGVAGDDATTGMWERGNPQGTWSGGTPCQPEDDHTPAPGVNCYATGLAAGTSIGTYDIDGGKTTLLSPVYDLSGHTIAFVSYWRWYTNSMGSSPGEDIWEVQASDDGGTSWVYLENTSESRNAWTRYSFPLHDHIDLTSNVRFRFIASDEGSGSVVEAAVDDFAISIWDFSTAVEGGSGAAPERVLLAQNVPNPFNPSTEIRFSVPAPGQRVTLRIFDVAGRTVKTLIRNEKVSGSRSATWNGENDAGEPVGSGIYLYRLDTGKERLSRKLVLVR